MTPQHLFPFILRINRFDPRLNDRIALLEDHDHDGQADDRTVFWDQAKGLTSIEVGLGGVWAMAPHHLCFIPGAEGDDTAGGGHARNGTEGAASLSALNSS